MEYKEMLKKARSGLPSLVFEKARFDIPKIRGHIQGNRTVISNFLQISSSLRREPSHILKYILKELATPGEIKKSGSVIMGTKVSAFRINEKIRKYSEEFLFCKECGKPDTKILKEGQFSYIKCMACGAKYSIKSRI
ncbi:MAG: translation initiation factor IF-2 subunit beta [Nanoarchaeota archaeon]